MTNNVDTL